jgi:hypothetical protein
MASGAGGIGPVFAEEDPVVDFVSLPLHPFKEPFEANEFSFPVEQNIFLMSKKFLKRFLGWDLVPPAGLPQVVIKFFIGGRVPGGKGFFF